VPHEGPRGDPVPVKGAKNLIPGSSRSSGVRTWRQISGGSPPLCLFSRGSAGRHLELVHTRARIQETAERRKNRQP
jgi:hypothetical protein